MYMYLLVVDWSNVIKLTFVNVLYRWVCLFCFFIKLQCK